MDSVQVELCYIFNLMFIFTLAFRFWNIKVYFVHNNSPISANRCFETLLWAVLILYKVIMTGVAQMFFPVFDSFFFYPSSLLNKGTIGCAGRSHYFRKWKLLKGHRVDRRIEQLTTAIKRREDWEKQM